MDAELELVKVRILANHLQRKIYSSGSFVLVVSVFIMFLSWQIRPLNPVSFIILVFIMSIIGYSTIIDVKKNRLGIWLTLTGY